LKALLRDPTSPAKRQPPSATAPLFALTALLAACGGSDDTPAPAPAPAPTFFDNGTSRYADGVTRVGHVCDVNASPALQFTVADLGDP